VARPVARNTELTARVAELLAVVAEQAALIGVAAGRAGVAAPAGGRDFSTSSQPPGQDGPAAEARAEAGSRRARSGQAQGGQKGHPGAGLQMATRPGESRVAEPDTSGRVRTRLAREPRSPWSARKLPPRISEDTPGS
jgi:hypothetical protein